MIRDICGKGTINKLISTDYGIENDPRHQSTIWDTTQMIPVTQRNASFRDTDSCSRPKPWLHRRGGCWNIETIAAMAQQIDIKHVSVHKCLVEVRVSIST